MSDNVMEDLSLSRNVDIIKIKTTFKVKYLDAMKRKQKILNASFYLESYTRQDKLIIYYQYPQGEKGNGGRGNIN